MMRIHEVLLEVSRYKRRNRENKPSWLPENWDVCLDEDELKVFYEYALDLWQNGVDLADPYVQQVIEGNYLSIESACVVTLQYASKGHFMYEGKIDCEHATRFFIKALLEGWKPLDQV